MNRAMEEIKIGNQIWLKKNLDIETFRNGDVIPEAKTEEEWKEYGDAGEAAWCYYDNDRMNGEKYGKLYNWHAVNDSRGLAPKGWHVPTHEEWDELVEYLGGEAEAGERMKTSHRWEENGNGTDDVGFLGLLGGSREFQGTFDDIGEYGYWWSSTEYDTDSACYRYLYSNNGNVYMSYNYKEKGFSVRLLRD